MKAIHIVPIGLLLGLSVWAASNTDERERRLTPTEIAALPSTGPGAGTSGVGGIRTTVLSGDPTREGLYTIRLEVPANAAIAAHKHRDDRVATVISGVWYFGYGSRADPAAFKELPAGSFYTEPANVPHFAETRSAPVVVHITGQGPTDTSYVDAAADPRRR
jgi:quercetin dioxygenase-like cupin family protein